MTYTVPAGRYGDYSTAFIQAYIDQKIADVVDLAPDSLNTLNELAAAIGDDANVLSNLQASIQAVQDDVDANETAAANLVSALETARGLITDALASRLDALELDSTTATAVANVQADVDQNEADADAAIALKLNAANPAATGDLTVDTEARLEFDSNITKLHNDLRGTRLDIGNNITVYPAAAGGRFEIEGGLYIRLSDLEEHNNDNDAGNAGIVVGGVYYDSNGHLRIRRS